MPSIVDKFLEGGEIRRKREQAEGLAQRQQQQLGIQQQDADMRLRKDNTRRFFGGVNELKLLSDQGDWNGVMRVTQDIAQIDPRFAEGSEMISNQLANGDIDGVKQSINNSYQLGLDNGLINDPRLREAKLAKLRTTDNRTANSKDWAEFQSLVQKSKRTGDPEDISRATQFGRRSNFIKPTEQESADIKVTAAERALIGKANAKRRQGFIDSGIEAADSMSNIHRSLSLLESVKTGGIDNALLKAKQFFGVEGADELELSSNLGKNVLAQLKPIFGSAFTAAEGDKLDRLEAKFGSSTAGNIRLLKQALKITNRAARRGLAAAEKDGSDFTAKEIRNAMAFRIDDKDFVSEPLPKTGGNQGGVLHIDANGNKAMVFPDGSFEEVQ